MLASGLVVAGRFRVLRNFGPAADSIALAEDLRGGERLWLVQVPVSASAAQVELTLEQQARFALGVPGLARAVASGVDAGAAFLAFVAPLSGSVADALGEPWPRSRVAAFALRVDWDRNFDVGKKFALHADTNGRFDSIDAFTLNLIWKP